MAGSFKGIRAHFNIKTLKTYVGSDKEALREFLLLAIAELDKSYHTLFEKAAANDFSALKKLGHKLYGTALTAGAMELAALAKRIEHLTEFDQEPVADLVLQAGNEILLVKKVISKYVI